MDYRAALLKPAPVKPVVEQPKMVYNCIPCSKVKLTKEGICKCCKTKGYSISECGICDEKKLTLKGYCKECVEEEEDEGVCKVCGDTDTIYGQCLSCIKYLYRSNNGNWD